MFEKQWVGYLVKGMCLLVVAACLAGGCSYINKRIGLSDDHFAEEFLEEQIEEHIGLDIDLSHESPE